jgi:hypothetical protein
MLLEKLEIDEALIAHRTMEWPYKGLFRGERNVWALHKLQWACAYGCGIP